MNTLLFSIAGLVLSLQTLSHSGISTTSQVVTTQQPIDIAAKLHPVETKIAWITAYSSTPEETDETPFVTASGKMVRDGIVATNMLPFGTKIKIPDLFGEKVFIVEDRMHRSKKGFVDIWMHTKDDAIRFGIAKTDIVILN